jgi:hypothetical protein
MARFRACDPACALDEKTMSGSSARLIAAVLCSAWLASGAAAADDGAFGHQTRERAESRVGRTFWARPGLSDTSVEFYKEPELRGRAPVYRKARFKVLDVLAIRPFPEPEPVYRVRFEGGGEAYIAVEEFDRLLFREPRANQVVTTTFTPPLGEGVHVYVFNRSSIFAADPDVIWERIRNDGPRSFRPVGPGQPDAPPPK